jgi:hypothetical protein
MGSPPPAVAFIQIRVSKFYRETVIGEMVSNLLGETVGRGRWKTFPREN